MGSGPSSWIVYGATYQIASFIFPTVDQPINDAAPSPATLLDLQGVFLLDQWMSGSILENSTNAAAVQTQLWLSEGYTETEISGEGGINNLSAIEGTIATLLTSLGYTGSWIPGDNVAVLEAYGDNGYQSNGSPAQDQYVYIGGAGPSDLAPVPEPASFVIWSLIAGWSWLGMRVWRRRGAGLVVDREARQPWSPEDRRAIRALVARRGSR